MFSLFHHRLISCFRLDQGGAPGVNGGDLLHDHHYHHQHPHHHHHHYPGDLLHDGLHLVRHLQVLQVTLIIMVILMLIMIDNDANENETQI